MSMISKSMRNSVIGQTKQSLRVSPTMDRLIQSHYKNKQRQLKSQNISNKILKDFQEKRQIYQIKNKQKQQDILKRFKDKLKINMLAKKKKINYAQKIIQKYRVMSEQKMSNKIANINKKNKTILNQFSQKYDDISQRSNSFTIKKYKYLNNCPNLKLFYKQNFLKIQQVCQEILDRSLSKQKKAQQNRKIINNNSKIKQLNIAIINKQVKALKQLQNKQNNIIKKQVQKLLQLQKFNREQIINKKKKQKQRKQKQEKNITNLKKKRLLINQQLQNKYNQLQKIIFLKQQKVNKNKQHYLQNLIENHKKYRLKYINSNQTRLNQSQDLFTTKMSNLYQKDRKQWTFMTTLYQQQDQTIQKNIYQNNQISLQK